MTRHTASYISHIWRCRLKLPQMKQPWNPSQSSPMMPWRYHRWKQNNQNLRWRSVIMELNRDCAPLEKFTETESLLISHSMSTICDKRTAVRVTITTESPYLIGKKTQIAEFSVVTPEQSKHIKRVDMAIRSMIPQGDPDLTTYLNELLRTNKPEQQNSTFSFPTPEKFGKPEDHTPYKHETSKN